MATQNYDQGTSPQAKLRRGKLRTSRITTREPTHKENYDQRGGWLAGWRNYDQGGRNSGSELGRNSGSELGGNCVPTESELGRSSGSELGRNWINNLCFQVSQAVCICAPHTIKVKLRQLLQVRSMCVCMYVCVYVWTHGHNLC